MKPLLEMTVLTRAKIVAQSAAFQKFRPAPPVQLIKKVVAFLNEKVSTPFDTAVDMGCGSGVSTEALSPYFKNVIGFDTRDMRNNYTLHKGEFYNVIYRNGTPEGIGCLDSTVHLVTASQTAHWFDLKKFYSETERILVPGGVLAIYGYSLPTVRLPTTDANQLIQDLMLETLTDFMPPQSKKLYLQKYRTDDFRTFLFNKEPLRRDETTYVELDGTVSDLVDYIRNTSTVQNYEKSQGSKTADKLMDEFQKQLLKLTGSTNTPDKTKVKILFNFVAVMGRKPF